MVVIKEIYYDGYLKKNLDVAKEAIQKDWDMVFCTDGIEGSGKSLITLQAAYYCDPTLTLDRVCFTPREFQEAILKAKKYQAVIFDEAFTGLSSREAMGRINKSLIKMLAEIRQKNLFVFVVMPSFFDLDKYVALHRSRALIHVYTGKKFERGFFSFYNMERKTNLYVNGKKYYNYFKPDPNFRGSFTHKYPIDEAAYREKKRKSLQRKVKGDVDDVEFKKRYDKVLFDKLMSIPEDEMTYKLKARVMGMTKAGLWQKRKRKAESTEDSGDEMDDSGTNTPEWGVS